MRFCVLIFLLLAPFLTAATPLTQSAYVWQRAHTPAVSHAITAHARSFDTLIVLAAEVSWQKTNDTVTAQITRVRPDWTALKNAPRLGLALRINAFPGTFAHDDASIRTLVDLSRELLTTATAHGVTISEFQIDYDATTASLPGYHRWLDALHAAVAPAPLTFTALPTWLASAEFASLARATDGFVLQVHSLERPRTLRAAFTLCDPVAAQRAITRAAQVGVPFRVALPTYAYTLAFDPTGRFAGLAAEGPSPDWPADFTRREVRSDPVALANLVQAINTAPPANLTGFIWYRLPIVGDQRNWSWPTLASVMAGRAPISHVQIIVVSPTPGLHDLVLLNDGDGDFTGPIHLTVRWPSSRPLGTDALAGFTLSANDDTSLQLVSREYCLPADTRLTVGWLRLLPSSLPPHVTLEN